MRLIPFSAASFLARGLANTRWPGEEGLGVDGRGGGTGTCGFAAGGGGATGDGLGGGGGGVGYRE